MKKRLFSALLAAMMVLSLAACGSSSTTTDTTDTATDDAVVEDTADDTAEATDTVAKIGISMPTQDLQRWNQDGANMVAEFEAAGYEVEILYADNDDALQVTQIETLISNGADVLVVAAITSTALGTAMDQALEAGIPVISYDRLIEDTDAVAYYVSFDNYVVGQVQGQYIIDTLDLANTTETYTMEITAGDPADTNAGYFFNGAMDLLQPYIDNGTIVVTSGQTSFEEAATDGWSTETAQSRMDAILASYYSDGTQLDICLCSNDSTALGVVNSLTAAYTGEWPIVTGQDCDIANVLNILDGAQSMSVFKDTRTLASQTVTMVTQMLEGETVDVNDTTTYNNGYKDIESYLCDPVFCDASNYEEILIDSEYYSLDDLGL